MSPVAPGESFLVGVLSDTHGRLDPAIGDLFRGVHTILHAGDLGAPDVLVELETIAPVTAVRGNVDVGGWAARLPEIADVTIHGTAVRVSHRRASALGTPLPDGCALVVFGHTHAPLVTAEHGMLFLNPGSAASGRSGSDRSVALVRLGGRSPEVRIIAL